MRLSEYRSERSLAPLTGRIEDQSLRAGARKYGEKFALSDRAIRYERIEDDGTKLRQLHKYKFGPSE